MSSLSRYEAEVQRQGHSFSLHRTPDLRTGAYKAIICGTLDGKPVVSAKPKTSDGKTAEVAKTFFQKEMDLLARCQKDGVEGILQPILRISYTGKNGEIKYRMIFPHYEGDLFDLLCHGLRPLTNPAKDIPSIQEQLLVIGDELRRKGYIHRDIKPENILWKKKADGTIKIILCDVGFLRLPDDQTPLEWAGPSPEIAPEYAEYMCSQTKTQQLLEERTTDKLDAWGMGVVMFCLVDPRAARFLRSQSNEECLRRSALWYRKNTVGLSIKNAVITGLLRPNPIERLNASQALALFRENRITQASHEALPFPDGIP